MAIDTAGKRFSMMGFDNPVSKYVVPSGVVDAAARATFLDLYSGIALDPPVEPPALICLHFGLISNQIAAVNGPIVQETTAVAGTITDTLAVAGLISSQFSAVEGVIEDDITAVVGTIDC